MLKEPISINNSRAVLGVWDGHDAGAALVQDGQILFAVNEERFSRRKLEIGFPRRSIAWVLSAAELEPEDVTMVAASTSDFAKTLTRLFPGLREEYYLLRRRKKLPGAFYELKKSAKYLLTEWPPSRFSRTLSSFLLGRELKALGLSNARLHLVDHHLSHIACAALCSGFNDCLAVSLDGIGDGLSGRICSFSNGSLSTLAELPGSVSFGIFFEHVTNLLNMRELEDEGKVMALADFSSPVADDDNPLLKFLSIEGLTVSSPVPSRALYGELKRIFWQYPSEQFAKMAQRTLEVKVCELIRNALCQSGQRKLAYAGGLASNVKVNLLLRELPEVAEIFVFPHMGDGGLAAGAALLVESKLHSPKPVELGNVFLGPAYDEVMVLEAASSYPDFELCPQEDLFRVAAELLSQGEILMWFQGRMEFGPRALGQRSILALPNSLRIKDELNLKLKKRVWYQPFCPVMLESEAYELLLDYHGPVNAFMTSCYRVRKDKQELLCGAISRDGTCRPQIIKDNDPGQLAKLLLALKPLSGTAALINTSFNLHGEPIVESPEDAFCAFANSELRHLVIEKFLVKKKHK